MVLQRAWAQWVGEEAGSHAKVVVRWCCKEELRGGSAMMGRICGERVHGGCMLIVVGCGEVGYLGCLSWSWSCGCAGGVFYGAWVMGRRKSDVCCGRDRLLGACLTYLRG